MKRFFQQSGLTVSPLLDTVSGIVKQNAAAKTTQSDKAETQQYLRLPLESARRLRWFDSLDLNQIIRAHIREKQELIDLNDRLRRLLIEKGLVREDVLNHDLVQHIVEVDKSQIINESVASALLVSAQEELEILREQLQHTPTSTPNFSPKESWVSLVLDVENEDPARVTVAFQYPPELQQSTDLGIAELLVENSRLSALLDDMKQKEKKTELPSEMVTKAHNMCLKAEEAARAAEHRVHEAQILTARAEEKERMALREAAEISKKLKRLTEHHKQLALDQKAEVESMKKDYQSKEQECKSLVERNISLRSELDEVSMKVMFHESLMLERDELLNQLRHLEESSTELKILADQSGHYKQITTEMEERIGTLEKELVSTAQKVGSLEKQLKQRLEQLQKEQTRGGKLERKLRQAVATKAEQNQPQSPEFNTLMTDFTAKEKELTGAQDQIKTLSAKVDQEQSEKMKLLSELSELEDRFISVEKQHGSATFQLRHQLTVAKKDLEEIRRYAGVLERERQNLCTKLHVKPDPALGFEDSRGGGTFHHAAAMTDASSRNGLSAIDTLYLKNVLFKFIEATAQQKTSERDLLLPAIATLLGASGEEFAQLRKALTPEPSTLSKGVFGFWQQR